MKRRRWRRIAIWAGGAACGACVLLLVANFMWEYLGVSYVAPGRAWGAHAGSAYGGLVAGFNQQMDYRLRQFADYESGDSEGWRVVSSSHTRSWAESASSVGLIAIYPRILFAVGPGWVSLPLWIPLVVAAIPTSLLWRSERRDRRRAAAGACVACGYDLTGNVTGRCPECGAAAEPAAGRERPS